MNENSRLPVLQAIRNNLAYVLHLTFCLRGPGPAVMAGSEWLERMLESLDL